MGLIRRNTSKVTARKKARDEEGGEKKGEHQKILTAEGWKRLMLSRSRKGSKTKN